MIILICTKYFHFIYVQQLQEVCGLESEGIYTVQQLGIIPQCWNSSKLPSKRPGNRASMNNVCIEFSAKAFVKIKLNSHILDTWTLNQIKRMKDQFQEFYVVHITVTQIWLYSQSSNHPYACLIWSCVCIDSWLLILT